VGTLAGHSGCASLRRVSFYGAASGNRQWRQDHEIVALMPLPFLFILLFYFSSK